jgi:hypothetical protein
VRPAAPCRAFSLAATIEQPLSLAEVIQKNIYSLIDSAKPLDSHTMISSQGNPAPIALRPAWRANISLFLVVALIAAASVFLAY